MTNSTFLSYRRTASEYLALALWQNLTAAGVDVFFDVETIGAGRFDTVILREVQTRRYFVPILTPGTLQRCNDPGDWLRRELEAAVYSDRVIVPVHTRRFDMEDIRRYLPAYIGDVVRAAQMVPIDVRSFFDVVEDLAGRYLVDH